MLELRYRGLASTPHSGLATDTEPQSGSVTFGYQSATKLSRLPERTSPTGLPQIGRFASRPSIHLMDSFKVY